MSNTFGERFEIANFRVKYKNILLNVSCKKNENKIT